MIQENENSAILLIHCLDHKGLVAHVAEFILSNDGNILYLDEYVDQSHNIFTMRVKWDLTDFKIPRDKIGEYFDTLVASRCQMHWTLYFSADRPKMGLLVSQHLHCLQEILSRWALGEWRVDIPLIISNHSNAQPLAERYGIPFHHLPVTPKTKATVEAQQHELLKNAGVDVIVLARYMQILSNDLVAQWPERIINIHHSFLPAFIGAKPYHSAHGRGVKLIGATSHYVTCELDAGPIIEQDVIRVSHKDSVAEMIRKGKDLERLTLAKAIWLHINHKCLVYGNRTVIFD